MQKRVDLAATNLATWTRRAEGCSRGWRRGTTCSALPSVAAAQARWPTASSMRLMCTVGSHLS